MASTQLTGGVKGCRWGAVKPLGAGDPGQLALPLRPFLSAALQRLCRPRREPCAGRPGPERSACSKCLIIMMNWEGGAAGRRRASCGASSRGCRAGPQARGEGGPFNWGEVSGWPWGRPHQVATLWADGGAVLEPQLLRAGVCLSRKAGLRRCDSWPGVRGGWGRGVALAFPVSDPAQVLFPLDTSFSSSAK